MNLGLILFVGMVAMDVAGLFLDLLLREAGCRTITDVARQTTWVAVGILGIQPIGAIGLALHLARLETWD